MAKEKSNLSEEGGRREKNKMWLFKFVPLVVSQLSPPTNNLLKKEKNKRVSIRKEKKKEEEGREKKEN